MRKLYYFFSVFIFAVSLFSGCVSDLTNPEDSAAAAAVSIKVTKPLSNDTVSYKGQSIVYSLTTNSGINFIELHVNGSYQKTFKPNSDGSKPLITLTVDSGYVNSNISYQLKYFDLKGYSETPVYSVYVTTTMAPPYIPYGVLATKLSGTAYNISWKDSSAGSVAYQVWRKIDDGEFALLTNTSAGVFNINDETVNPNKVYYYKVRAFNKFGYSDYSQVVNTLGGSANLWSGYAESSKSIVLTWSHNRTDINYYSIERKTTYSEFSRVGAVPGSIKSYRDSIGLSAGTEYIYRIKAYSSKDSSTSNEFVVRTFTYDFTPPSITSLTNIVTRQVTINWKDNDNTDGRFSIERKEQGGNYSIVGETNSWINSYDDISVVTGKTYYYRIREYNGDSYSQYSNEMSIEVKN